MKLISTSKRYLIPDMQFPVAVYTPVNPEMKFNHVQAWSEWKSASSVFDGITWEIKLADRMFFLI